MGKAVASVADKTASVGADPILRYKLCRMKGGAVMQHAHPRSGAVIEGTLLGAGTRLERADVYDSRTGKWESVPSALVGTTIPQNHGATFVRPDACSRCGAADGRHRGGCALAPAMYKTPEGIPVARSERHYSGDADEDGAPGMDYGV